MGFSFTHFGDIYVRLPEFKLSGKHMQFTCIVAFWFFKSCAFVRVCSRENREREFAAKWAKNQNRENREMENETEFGRNSEVTLKMNKYFSISYFGL